MTPSSSAPITSAPARRVVEVCAALAGGLSAVFAVAWLMGAHWLAAFGSNYGPMMPPTAWGLLLLNLSVFALGRRPGVPAVKVLVRTTALLVGGLGALLFVRLLMPGLSDWELWLASAAGPGSGARLSPHTTGTFLAASLSLLLLTAPRRRLRPWETLASSFAILAGTSGLVAAIGFLLGGPLVLGTDRIPMSLSTALAFIVTAIGLIVSAHPQMWGRGALDGHGPFIRDPFSRRFRWAVGSAVALLVVGIALTVTVYLRRELSDLRDDQYRAVAQIASFKAVEIARWRAERQADADVLAQMPLVRHAVTTRETRAGYDGPADLRAYIQLVQERYGYEWVEVLDAGHHRLASSPARTGPLCPEVERIITAGLQPGHAVMSDVHREGPHDAIGLALVVRLAHSDGLGGAGDPSAVLVLHIDARKAVFASLQVWPTTSRSGEALLARRDGDSLLFLSDARHLPRTALTRRVPLGATAAPVRRALAGLPSSGEGIDYRGVPAIVAARLVPGSPWLVITKVDQQETYAHARERVWAVSLSLGFFGVGIALGLTLIRRQRDALVLERDLKERRRREGVEQDYQTLFREMLDGFAVHEIICDADGVPADYRFLAANPAFERLTGLKAEEIVGKTVLQILPATEPYWIQTYGAVALTGEPAFFERYTQGLDKYFQVTAYRPSPWQFACIFQDVTERRRAEEHLRQSEEKFALAFQMSPNAISIVRVSDGRYIDVNEAFATISGYSRVEVLTQDGIADRLWVDLRDRKAAAAILETEGALAGQEYFFRRKDGDIILGQLSSHAIFLNGEACVLSSISDITERRRTQELLIQTEKMMSVGGLAAGMAHEINNPLSIIRQAIENVDRRLTADLPVNHEEAARAETTLDALRRYQQARGIPAFLQDIRDAASRANKIVSGMLHFARTSDHSKEPTDVAALLDQAVVLASNDAYLQQSCDFRRMDITREYDPDTPAVMSAPIEIEQVLLNLLTNAGHAMAANDATRPPKLVLRVSRDGRHVVVQIEDNGPGMTPEVKRRVFEPFFTTKAPGAGTGLGLSVAYAIVSRNHGGHIEADSVPGHGSCFTVRLPLAPADDGVPALAGAGEQDG